MPKSHFSTAPAHVLRRIAMVQETDSIITSQFNGWQSTVPAAGVLGAIQAAQLAGYAWTLDDLPLPHTTRLAELEHTGAAVAAARYRTENSLHLEFEKRCVQKVRALERWAAEPSAAEVAEAERPERERLAIEAALEKRTAEIAEAAEVKRLAGVKSKAREQAQKELET